MFNVVLLTSDASEGASSEIDVRMDKAFIVLGDKAMKLDNKTSRVDKISRFNLDTGEGFAAPSAKNDLMHGELHKCSPGPYIREGSQAFKSVKSFGNRC